MLAVTISCKCVQHIVDLALHLKILINESVNHSISFLFYSVKYSHTV